MYCGNELKILLKNYEPGWSNLLYNLKERACHRVSGKYSEIVITGSR